MTIVIDNRIDSAMPQTHALIISVNEYPFLRGGARFVDADAGMFRLKQLTSPVISAEHLVNFLRTYQHPRAPLGTVDWLSSPAPTSEPGIARATFLEIRKAFDGWYQRCNQLAQNVAVLYFCGHGMDVPNSVLLAEDFACDPVNPWENGIDFKLTYDNMAELGAQTQCFFLDACREQPTSAMVAAGQLGIRPLRGKRPNSRPARNAPILRASALGELAHAESNQVSYFTRSLVDCWSRLGANHLRNQSWYVTISSLKSSLKERMLRTIKAGDAKPGSLSCDTGGGIENLPDPELHRLASAEVMARIACDPESALGMCSLFVNATSGRSWQQPAIGTVWDFELPVAEVIEVGGHLLPGAPFQNVISYQGLTVIPPRFDHFVEVH